MSSESQHIWKKAHLMRRLIVALLAMNVPPSKKDDISARAESNIRNEFQKRARNLNISSRIILCTIVAFVIGASATLYIAETITSNELSSISRKISSVASNQGDLIAEITPSLIKVRRNADVVNAAISEFAQEIEIGDKEAREKFDDDKAREQYYFYGYASTSDLLTPKAFSIFLSGFIKAPAEATKEHPKKDIIVVRFDSLYEDVANPKLGQLYIWAFKKSSIDRMIKNIDGVKFSDPPFTDSEGQELSNTLDKIFAFRVEISSLKKVMVDALEDYNSAPIENPDSASDKFTAQVKRQNPSIGDYLLQLNINKFGILSVEFVIVGLLTSVYRYSRRLAGFYQARADALGLVSAKDLDKFIQLASVLSPTTIGFDKAGVVEGLLDAAKPKEEKKEE